MISEGQRKGNFALLADEKYVVIVAGVIQFLAGDEKPPVSSFVAELRLLWTLAWNVRESEW